MGPGSLAFAEEPTPSSPSNPNRARANVISIEAPEIPTESPSQSSSLSTSQIPPHSELSSLIDKGRAALRGEKGEYEKGATHSQALTLAHLRNEFLRFHLSQARKELLSREDRLSTDRMNLFNDAFRSLMSGLQCFIMSDASLLVEDSYIRDYDSIIKECFATQVISSNRSFQTLITLLKQTSDSEARDSWIQSFELKIDDFLSRLIDYQFMTTSDPNRDFKKDHEARILVIEHYALDPTFNQLKGLSDIANTPDSTGSLLLGASPFKSLERFQFHISVVSSMLTRFAQRGGPSLAWKYLYKDLNWLVEQNLARP